MINHALSYAGYGWSVFPCGRDKKPLAGSRGFKDASQDAGELRRMFADPQAESVGLATGRVSGVFVLDVDLPEGPASLAALEAKHGPLPTTLEQRTGGGGRQLFFFHVDGIRNSASKLGKDLDVRGDGGYAILPPSPHPEGGTYTWTSHADVGPAEAPQWLVSLCLGATRKAEAPRQGIGATPYGLKALAAEIANLSGAAPGSRNDSLNTAAFRLAQLVAGGELDRFQAEAALHGTAMAMGLPDREAWATIKSGIESGLSSPRSAEPEKSQDKLSGLDKLDSLDKSDSLDRTGQDWTRLDRTGHDWTRLDSARQGAGGDFAGNLTAEIRDWVKNSTGSFMAQDIDREFGLATRQAKKLRSSALSKLVEERIINRDLRIKSKYHAIETTCDFLDLENIDESNFTLELPLGLSKLVNIPPKSLILLAGSPNSGKTALLLNLLRANWQAGYQRVYLPSEMGPSEIKQRLLLSGESVKAWQAQVKIACKSTGFDGVIGQHNPDGLTVVDFLEEVDGEYYKIASDIRRIYDALGNGVAVIAIQKKAGQLYGRGGSATEEKPRLYLALDKLLHVDRCTICSLRIVKAKSYCGENPNDKEIHFAIHRGWRIEPLSEWAWVKDKEREGLVRKYEMQFKSACGMDVPYEMAPF